jgi:D-xylose reductase
VDPKVRYPPGWSYDGKGNVQTTNTPIQETWNAMEALVDKGLTRSIGISNFQGSLILDLLRYAKIRPAALQIEHHPYLVQETLLRLARSENIAVVAYSTFGPQSFIELDWQNAHDTPTLFNHPVINLIAQKHSKTPAQIILRWVTQRGIAVMPKSNSQSRMEQNLHVVDFDLADEDIKAISGLDKNVRFNNPTDVSLS